MFKKTKNDLRRIQELRRSNAATPLKNLKKYSRKDRQTQSEMLKYKYDPYSF
jgi:hypothetical protein